MAEFVTSHCSHCGGDYPAKRNACPHCGYPNYVELLCGHCGHLFFAEQRGLIQCENESCRFEAGVIECGNCQNNYWQGSPACPFCHASNADSFVACRVCGFYFYRVLDTCPECRCAKDADTQSSVNALQTPETKACPKCHFTFPAEATRCPRCGLRIPDDSSSGYVYVLVHPHMQGLVKIGKTQRPTAERIAELSQHTGVPGRFVLAYEQHVTNCDIVEVFVHERLKGRRIQGKEFFRIGVEEAIEAVIQASAVCRVRKD